VTTTHVPEPDLARFVEGDLDEPSAAQIAVHIDSCSKCATRAAALDPLNAWMATLASREPPDDLAARVLARFHRAERPPHTELVVGAALITAGTILGLLLEGPWGLVGDVGSVVAGGLALVRSLSTSIGTFPLVLVASTLAALAGVLATLRYLARSTGLHGLRVTRRQP
jgi:anti-sigma factor RsiW